METYLILLGIIPVLVYVVLESFTSKRAAVGAALALALLEMIFTLVTFGRLDELTLLSFAVVGVLGLLSVKKDNDLYYKLHPAILHGFFACAFFVFYYILDKPLLNYLINKYAGNRLDGLFDNQLVSKHFLLAYIKALSRDMSWWLLLHALLTAFAAWRLSKWWWLVISVPGLILIVFLAAIVARYTVMM